MFIGQLLFLLYLQKNKRTVSIDTARQPYKLTAGMTTHTNPVEAQARPNPSKK